ncbi:MAG: peroxiredoxin [Alphaproteobacteria bacterium]|nr:peroxiredoxin [Alphaproteobacteria bacterium]
MVTYPVDVGDAAPAFSLPAANGRAVSLKEFAGRSLVLFFYPKDDTTACTREAQAFSSMQSRFARRGIAVVGVSRDTVSSHMKFIAKYDLKVRLASDESGVACESYGVWQEKQLYGRRYMGIERTTFLIGADQVIRQVWRNVRVPGHVDAVWTTAIA